jgi:Na+/H+ antiporter NhaC
MSILFPLVIPLAWDLEQSEDMALQCVGAILGGSIFGNCCSPIADTTIITALSTGCDLQSHTRTVLPYMLAPAVSAFLFGSLPVAFGWYPSAGIVHNAQCTMHYALCTMHYENCTMHDALFISQTDESA